MAITGAHAIVYTRDAEALRAFFRDVLGFSGVDAGGGWLIFGLPPAELAAHPARRAGRHQIYLMCDDIDATMAELESRGAEFSDSVEDQGWGREVGIKLPGGGELGLYEPRHPTAAG